VGVSKFLKKVGTRIVMRYDNANKVDKWGLAHGVITKLVRDDFQNLIACDIRLDEGQEFRVTPTKLGKEELGDGYRRI